MDNAYFNNDFIKNKTTLECYPCYKAQDHRRILEHGLYSVTGYNQLGFIVFCRYHSFFIFKTQSHEKKMASIARETVG